MRILSRIFARAQPLPGPRASSGSSIGNFLLWLAGAPIDIRPIKTREDQLSAFAGWAYAAVSTIAQDVRANPWAIWRKSGQARSEWERLDDDQINPILMRPNAMQTWGDLIESTQLHLDLAGESFWHFIAERNRTIGIELIYPHWIDEPIQDDNGRVSGWKVSIPGRPRTIVPASDVALIRYPHPLDPLRGASPVEAYAIAHDMDVYARAYGSSLLKNRAVPELVISSEQDITSEQADVIRNAWIDRYRDPRNGPAVIGRGAKVQQLGLGMRDLAFLEMTNASRDLILSIYKVPAAKVGLTTDFNRANAEAADATYKENCILPRLRRIEEAINLFVLPRLYGEQARSLWFEFESPVDEDREFALRRANDMLNAGAMTINQYRDALGESPIDGGDVFMVPLGKRILGSLTQESGSLSAETLDDERMIERIKDAVGSRGADGASSRRMPQPNARYELAELRFVRSQGALERELAAAVRVLFTREQQLIIAEIKNNLTRGAWNDMMRRDWLDDVMRKLEGRWRGTLSDFIVRGYREGWLLLSADIDSTLSFDLVREEAVRLAERIAGEKVTEITDETMLKVREVITAGVAEGKSAESVANDIRALYDGFRGSRALTIARTETAAAVNGGKEMHASEIEERLGMKLVKTWIATDDDRTRPSHVEANDQTVMRDQPFELAGGNLMYPGDPSGPPGEIINCRCTVIYDEAD
jgi:HK97 family phage portal protein